jgi:glycosyltransferase involved in cell wall biosynthesis
MSDHEPLVSIVTPAFNAERTIARTIESVQSQYYQNWEMNIVDDCSSDKTREVVTSYCERDARVRLICQPTNQGPACARNASIEAAHGDMVAFLDSDDWWLPEKLTEQLEFMRATSAALSYTQFRRVSADSNRVGEIVRIPERLTYDELLCNNAIATSTAIVDRRQTGAIRMIRTYYDDYALWLSILKRGFVAYGLPQDLMRYFVLGGSVSRNKLRSARKTWMIFREVEQLGMLQAARCFVGYAVNGVRKYRRF